MTDVVRDTNPDLDQIIKEAGDLYDARMHAPNGPTIRQDNRIDGILTIDVPRLVELLRVERVRREKAETALRRIEEKARSGLVYVDGWTNDLRRHEIAELARAVLAGEGDEQQ